MNNSPNYPSGPVPLDSPFYIPRPPVEELVYEEISKPGALIRIKGAKEMGKSSLMLRIVDYAKNLGYQIAAIDFQQFDADCLNNLDRFLRSFCLQVTKQLNLEPNLDEYWDEDIGSKVSCSLYFRWHILENLTSPLVLVLNEVNELFEYPQLTQDFLPLLRSWYEEAKQVPIWRSLRLTVVYTTEVYVPLKITQSPFNIGLPVQLGDFTAEQVEELAKLHQLEWHESHTEKLMAMVGGHPILVRLALYHLTTHPEDTLENLLNSAASDTGIYAEHLQRLSRTLEQDPQLKIVFQNLILANTSLKLPQNLSYKLESLGLAHLTNNQANVSHELYQKYFWQKLPSKIELTEIQPAKIPANIITSLAEEYQKLKQLAELDELTHLANRRFFENQLQDYWKQLSDTQEPLSLIIGEIDYFKVYKSYYGDKKANQCLQQVAQAFIQPSKSEDMLVARYGDAQFAVILPRIDKSAAVEIAKNIQAQVQGLKIEFNIPDYFGFPDSVVTISLGLTTMMLTANSDLDDLIFRTEKALQSVQIIGGNSLKFV
jgi:diguanylate cyclase (GGDEF)-like protein